MKPIKRFAAACFALAFVMTACVIGVSAEKRVTATANGINVVRESGYLVIYTPDMGERTGTNEWGCEAVIENDRCISVGGGNNAIPRGGFVVSGHDEEEGGTRMGEWIRQNIAVGDYVYYTQDGKITVSDKALDQPSFYEVATGINGVNVIRGEDYLVIYNRRGQKTGTNQWGYEVVVTAGTVTAIGGNNNVVPSEEGSFVISGHGKMVTWLQENAKLGLSAEYDEAKKTLKLVYDEFAAIAGAEAVYAQTKADYDSAVAKYMNFDHASVHAELDAISGDIAKARSEYDRTKDGGALGTAAEAISARLGEVRSHICETPAVEYRGVWLRPTQTSAAEVDNYVQKLYDAGINMICIETIYDCTMIMPMPESSLFEVNPKFAHFDLLRAYIDSCHKRGMELHCWFPIFYVGDGLSQNAKRSPGVKKPEWRSVNEKGSPANENNFMMLDPANEEVQDFLLANYRYILETYDIDGFQLDYIRYYESGEHDFGYNPGAIAAFKEKYGVTPEFNKRASYWSDWVQFRCDQVTRFVSRMRKLIDEVAPDVLLGADVGPDPAYSKATIYQDYFTWLKNGWIDILFPMSYGLGYESAIASQVDRCGDNSMLAVGLGIFMPEMDPDIMFDQVSYDRSAGAEGSCFFEAGSYLRKNTGDRLKESVYAERALAPFIHRGATAAAAARDAQARVADVIVPLGGMSAQSGEAVTAALEAFASSCGEDEFDYSLFEAALAAIDASDAKPEAAEALKAGLNVIVKLKTISEKKIDLDDLPDTPSEYIDDASSEADASEDDGASAESGEAVSQIEETTAAEERSASKTAGIVLAAAAGVLAVGAVIASVLFKKKKKK